MRTKLWIKGLVNRNFFYILIQCLKGRLTMFVEMGMPVKNKGIWQDKTTTGPVVIFPEE